MYLFRRRRFF